MIKIHKTLFKVHIVHISLIACKSNAWCGVLFSAHLHHMIEKITQNEDIKDAFKTSGSNFYTSEKASNTHLYYTCSRL